MWGRHVGALEGVKLLAYPKSKEHTKTQLGISRRLRYLELAPRPQTAPARSPDTFADGRRPFRESKNGETLW